MAPLRLRIKGHRFYDSHNREITLRGINVAGDAKYPKRPDLPSHIAEDFYDGGKVSFVDRPFSIAEAATHFERLRKWGYNTIRYVFTWEAIEHSGPGQYDDEWIAHTIEILRIAKEHDFYVFMDPHQDVVRCSVYGKDYGQNAANNLQVVPILRRFGSPFVDTIRSRV